MEKLLIYGNNKISAFLIEALKGQFELEDITKTLDSQDPTDNIAAIIDTTNTTKSYDQNDKFLHNTAKLKELVDLSARTKAPFIFLFRDDLEDNPEDPIPIALELLSKYAKTKSSQYLCVQIEDIYGADINTSETLDNLFQNLINGKDLIVRNDLNEHYLLHQEDFIHGLKNIIQKHTDLSSKKTYTLFPKNPITEIELAHFMKDLSELEVDIDYAEDYEDSKPIELDTETIYPGVWKPEKELVEGIHEMFDNYDIPTHSGIDRELSDEQFRVTQESIAKRMEDNPKDLHDDYSIEDFEEKTDYAEDSGLEFLQDKIDESEPEIKTKPKKKKKVSAKRVKVMAASFIVAMLLSSLNFLVNSGLGIFHLNKSLANFHETNLAQANTHSIKSSKYLGRLNDIPIPIKLGAYSFGINKTNLVGLINTSQTFSGIVYHTSRAMQDEYPDLASLFPSDNNVLGATTNTAPSVHLSRALELIEINNKNIRNLEIDNKFLIKRLENTLEVLGENRTSLVKINHIKSYLPELLGHTTKQRYLVLFQDTNQPMPTGGKLKAYSVLEVEKGKLIFEKAKPISALDSQIDLNQSALKAPDPIAQFTSNENLYLKDANWNPDINTSAKKIINSYKYASLDKESFDGIIIANQDFLKDILGDIKPISVVGLNRKIDQSNFTEIYETHSLDKDKDTSESFIATMISGILSQISNKTNGQGLIDSVFNSLENKNLAFYHNNDKILGALTENNWASNLDTSNYDDYLYILDSYLDGTGSLDRNVQYQGYFSEDNNNFMRKVTITYAIDENKTESILNYIRALLPKDVSLTRATLSDKSGQRDITRILKKESVLNRYSYGADILINPLAKTEITLEYESKNVVEKDGLVDIFVQKQPGINPVEYEFIMSYPNGTEITPEMIPEEGIVKNGFIILDLTLDKSTKVDFPL